MSSLYIRRQIEPEIPRTWGLDRPADFDVNATTQRLTRGTTIYNKRKNEMLNFQKKKNIFIAVSIIPATSIFSRIRVYVCLFKLMVGNRVCVLMKYGIL